MSKTTIEIQSDEREMWKQEWLKAKTTTRHWYCFHINLYVIQYIQYSFLKDCERKKTFNFHPGFINATPALFRLMGSKAKWSLAAKSEGF